MTRPDASDQEVTDLIREIAAEHGVAVDRDDPILVLHTATRKILQDALRQSQLSVEEAIAHHRSELELAAAKWQDDAKRAASQLVTEVQTASATSVARALAQASGTAVSQVERAFERHEKVLALATLTCAAAAAVAVLAAGAFLLAGYRASEHPDVRRTLAATLARDAEHADVAAATSATPADQAPRAARQAER